MARGIEELAEMQVTGPVQGGDMVMKPDQAPVGAAALLSKMAKKNTPGIFKLPMPDKQMPDFMKVAAEGVEQQTAQGDSINKMAGELMRQGINIQGMGMDEIMQIYEQTFGSPGDVDEFGVSAVDQNDWRTILKMMQSGMSMEDIEAQIVKPMDEKTAALNSIRDDAKKVEAFAPEGEQLAYINKEEADILKLMGGSGEREPITGIESFKRTRKERKADNIAAETIRRAESGDTSDYVQRQIAEMSGSGGRPGGAYETEQAGKAYETFREGLRQDQQSPKSDAEIADAYTAKVLGGRDIQDIPGVETYSGFEDYADSSKDFNIFDSLTGLAKSGYRPYLDAMDMFAGGVEDWEKEQVRKLLRTLGTEDTATGWGNLLRQMKDQSTGKLSKKGQAWFDKRGDLADEILGDPDMDNEWAGMDDEEKFQHLIERMEKGGGKQFEKNYDPNTYYEVKDNENSAQYQRRMRDEGKWDPKEMAQLQREGKLDFTRENTAMIEEGRKRLEEGRQGGQERRSGGGGPVEKITEEEEVVTATDPRAGAFGVGGTMPYTEDIRTAGVETDVPLGRRFGIDKAGKYNPAGMDLSKAMEYATLGGYSQLEPFQEYLARRREHLDEDEPRYFDEEGNVIYSGVT